MTTARLTIVSGSDSEARIERITSLIEGRRSFEVHSERGLSVACKSTEKLTSDRDTMLKQKGLTHEQKTNINEGYAERIESTDLVVIKNVSIEKALSILSASDTKRTFFLQQETMNEIEIQLAESEDWVDVHVLETIVEETEGENEEEVTD